VLLMSVKQYWEAPCGGPTVGEALADAEDVGAPVADADGVALALGWVVMPFFALSASSWDA
jgi:hypothetical protein